MAGDTLAEQATKIAIGLGRARENQRAIRVARQLVVSRDASKFKMLDEVRVVSDHDGPAGRWVGVNARIIDFDWRNVAFPWRVQAESGAQMYCSSDMLTK
jgi:hypothetical protein